jgi:hypothetical protein
MMTDNPAGTSPSSTESFAEVTTPLPGFEAVTVETVSSPDDLDEIPEGGSESDREEGSQGTNDTDGISEFGNAGQVHYDVTKCLVRLSSKVNNRTMLCGFDRDTCPRRKHQDLQSNSEKIGAVGYYIATPNSKKTVLDAIEDTHITEEDMDRHKEENRLLLEAVGGSAQKRAAEQAYKAKSPPTVQIDPTPTIMGERSPTARRELMNDWLDALPATPRAPEPTSDPVSGPLLNVVLEPSAPTSIRSGTMGESSLIADLMLKLVTRVESMQSTQELLVDAIVRLEEKSNDLLADAINSNTFTPEANRATANVNRDSECAKLPNENSPAGPKPKTGTSSRDNCVCQCTTCKCNSPLEDEDVTSQVSERVPNKKNRGRFYAVAKGRRIGVFSNRRDLLKSITGFKGAI